MSATTQVDVSLLEEPFQTLCEDRSVHWTRRVEGEDELCVAFAVLNNENVA